MYILLGVDIVRHLCHAIKIYKHKSLINLRKELILCWLIRRKFRNWAMINLKLLLSLRFCSHCKARSFMKYPMAPTSPIWKKTSKSSYLISEMPTMMMNIQSNVQNT